MMSFAIVLVPLLGAAWPMEITTGNFYVDQGMCVGRLLSLRRAACSDAWTSVPRAQQCWEECAREHAEDISKLSVTLLYEPDSDSCTCSCLASCGCVAPTSGAGVRTVLALPAGHALPAPCPE
mmetsp:Transcript_16072/g.47934  ORF Transcript_16072/g.47934 Transcript_16072/m.47934 type:complete len:123 (+) Transcript_16072:171-539(+)|eukprot:CAMPEP_0119259654 /NCGR_PEP_ID=MMETSP1329-20130426/387_1 /TAXON_ID=114041 /ORGANISM="Genus nov. species nov., Strain RCC1024" /LENGTH=122 /DNA_ID=CAMNT_0007259049 /DNA_START=155 /DNA_END=523 /DNA_ORIENTATION=+